VWVIEFASELYHSKACCGLRVIFFIQQVFFAIMNPINLQHKSRFD
jgi:hypothetical protein